MTQTVVITVVVLLLGLWLLFFSQFSVMKTRILKSEKKNVQKQEGVEQIINKIENAYDEKSIRIMFQELDAPQLAEWLIVFERAEIVLILGEAYNFSEILNVKVGGSNYLLQKNTFGTSESNDLFDEILSGRFESMGIAEALALIEKNEDMPLFKADQMKTEISIITSHRAQPEIKIWVSAHSSDEVIVTLTKIIDKGLEA